MENRSHYIQERFPDKKHQINRLMAENSEYLALSEEYEICVTALRYWAGSTASEAETRVIEYHTLIKELEGEISLYFNCI